MAILTEEYRNRARREATKRCPLCLVKLDVDENKRGVVQFFDGWFFVCSSCKAKVGKLFDASQSNHYAEAEYIPYFKRSRRYFLKWLEAEYQIKIA